ncbi:MAG: hypothetical protein ATN35_06075 [Epulopiscium sp. Nele67-Bin004]|nr:MAG: hypothetical protein ATN35_06075 [Epulopiscium sp. Nele67-Bin004]
MVIIVVAIILSISETVIIQNSEAKLREIVYDNVEQIEFKDGVWKLTNIEFEEDGVRSAIFDEKMNMLEGLPTMNFLLEYPFENGVMQEIYIGSDIYILYDIKIPNSDMWVRGMLVLYQVTRELRMLIAYTLLFLPIFVIISTIGCYIIAKKELQPINHIVDTAKTINKGTDLTARINLEQGGLELYELATTFDEMFNRLEQSFELEKQFTSDVSHELRTPITVIFAQCEFAHNKTEEQKQEAFVVIMRQANKMRKLIADLLTLSRMDRGIDKANLHPTNLSELVCELCEEQEMIVPENIRLSWDIEKNITINIDELMINRLIINLINNAVKYNKDDGYVKVILDRQNDNVVLSVLDSGIGINKEEIPNIWRRFYQIDAARNNKNNMGLGLSMVAEIAKLHNAQVEVTSEIDVGSCFKIIF